MATVLDSHFLALTAIVTLGYQIFFFIITALLKFDKVTDFAGSTNFVIIAVLTLIIKGSWHFRQVVLTSLVVIWGLRLAIFLLMRILQWGEDRRFDEMRSNLGKLAVFWIFQAVWVWTVSLPVTVVNASDRDPSVRAEDIIGWIMWSVGISFEAAADQQKLSFKNSPENRGKWCNVGVWKYSRHPNYFGEIFLWWGIFVASTPILEGAEWLVILGPIFLTLLLLFVSGLPLLEESADKKFGNVAAYRIYKETTSPLIPLPQSAYGNLPLWFKAIFLFEFPFYSRSLPQEGLNWYMSKTSVSRKMKSGRNITYDLCCLDTRILLMWAYVIFNVFRRYFRASYPYTHIWIYIEHGCSRKMKNESNVAFDNANPTKTLHKSINYS